MSNNAIEIQNLSKRYRLIDAGSTSGKRSLLDYVFSPIRRFREIRSLTSFKDGDEKNIFWALKDINLNIAHGEVVGLIGKNGAGKSTLLKILSKITSPTTGKAILRGRVNSLLEVGTGFNPELTGRENIYMNGTLHGMSRKEINKKLEEIIDFAGVEKFIDIPVKRYSSGMGVRLGFAVAAHLEPEILIVDEVLAVGDAEFQKKAIGKMQDVSQSEGRTVVFVSHNMTTISGLCSKAILLEKGMVKTSGTANEVISNYLLKSRSLIIDNDISSRTDFSGSGVLKIGKVLINDSSSFKVLNATDVKFSIEIQNPNKLKGYMEFAGNISNQDGRVFHYFSSKLKQKVYNIENEQEFINFELKNLPLQAGIYYMLFEIKFNDDIVYFLESALQIEVEDNDFYKSGMVWRDTNDFILIDQKWY